MSAIRTRALAREYAVSRGNSVVALEHLDLDVAEGTVHGLLGPNGAGKTTLCKILSTILTPSSGSAAVLGYDVVKDADHVRRSIGLVLGGDRGLYARLTARQNLEFWAAMYGIPRRAVRGRIDGIIERVGLTDVDRAVERYSRGMKQRLHLARGLLAEPRVLLLDEPTIGFDPIAARSFRDLVRGIRGEGVTILLTTHDMAEAEELCDTVSLIDHGRLLASANPAALARVMSDVERIEVSNVPTELGVRVAEELAARDDVASATMIDGTLRVESSSMEAMRPVITRLAELGLTSIRVSRPDLRDVYVHLVGDRGMAID